MDDLLVYFHDKHGHQGAPTACVECNRLVDEVRGVLTSTGWIEPGQSTLDEQALARRLKKLAEAVNTTAALAVTHRGLKVDVSCDDAPRPVSARHPIPYIRVATYSPLDGGS